MKTSSDTLTRFKVRQAIGSLAIEGIAVSPETQAVMQQIASGVTPAALARAALVARYRQPAHA